jgi:hypothetical protein
VLVPFTQECGQHVFADAIPPQVIAAVATRMGWCVKIDPVNLSATGDPIAAVADAFAAQRQTSLEPIEVDATGRLEIDLYFVCHVLSPIQTIYSRSLLIHCCGRFVRLDSTAAPSPIDEQSRHGANDSTIHKPRARPAAQLGPCKRRKAAEIGDVHEAARN